MAPENESDLAADLRSTIKPYQPFANAIGGGISLYSNYLSNRQRVRDAEFDAARNRMNAAYSRLMAGAEREKGAADARLRGLRTSSEIGRVRAGFGASGVDANSGTPLALAADARMLGDYDAARIRHDAEVRAHGHDYDAYISSLSANLSDARARTLKKTGILDAVSGGLGIIGGFGL